MIFLIRGIFLISMLIPIQIIKVINVISGTEIHVFHVRLLICHRSKRSNIKGCNKYTPIVLADNRYITLDSFSLFLK